MFSRLKHWLATLLCSDLSGRLIAFIYSNRIPCPRYGNLRFDCNDPSITSVIKASIFWGSYEGSEIRMVQRWVDNKFDVIELGGSIGVMACHLARQIYPKKLVTVEAFPPFKEIIEHNLQINEIKNVNVVTGAIGQTNRILYFHPGDYNTTGTISFEPSSKALPVKAMTLSDLILELGIQNYVLVCDIEGSELSVLLDDPQSLTKCQMIIIETHTVMWNGEIYSTEDIKNLVINIGFKVAEQQGVNFVFTKL